MERKKIFFIFYILLSLLFITDVIAIQKFNISISGYWSDRFLGWIWVLNTLAFVIIFWKNTMTKIYLNAFLLGIALNIYTNTLPFSDIFLAATGLERFNNQQTLDGKYRVQLILTWPKLQIIRNIGHFEKVIVESDADFLKNNQLKIGYENIIKLELVKNGLDSITMQINSSWRKNVVTFKKFK